MASAASIRARNLEKFRAAISIAPKGAREPNGRPSRRVIDVEARKIETERQIMNTALEARQRIFGISEAAARKQEGGTLVGRMLQREELTNKQYDAAVSYLEARNAYHAAIEAKSDTGKAPSGPRGEGTYQEFVDGALAKWRGIEAIIQRVTIEVRSPAPAAALHHFLVREVHVPELVGDLRLVLNQLVRYFAGLALTKDAKHLRLSIS